MSTRRGGGGAGAAGAASANDNDSSSELLNQYVEKMSLRIRSCSRERPDGPAINAIDGTTRTFWNSGTNSRAILVVELQQPALLTQIRISNRATAEWEIHAALAEPPSERASGTSTSVEEVNPSLWIRIKGRGEASAPRKDQIITAPLVAANVIRITCWRGSPTSISNIACFAIPVAGMQASFAPLATIVAKSQMALSVPNFRSIVSKLSPFASFLGKDISEAVADANTDGGNSMALVFLSRLANEYCEFLRASQRKEIVDKRDAEASKMVRSDHAAASNTLSPTPKPRVQNVVVSANFAAPSRTSAKTKRSTSDARKKDGDTSPSPLHASHIINVLRRCSRDDETLHVLAVQISSSLGPKYLGAGVVKDTPTMIEDVTTEGDTPSSTSDEIRESQWTSAAESLVIFLRACSRSSRLRQMVMGKVLRFEDVTCAVLAAMNSSLLDAARPMLQEDVGLDAKEKTTSALEEVDNCIEDAVPMRVSRAAYVIISLATSSTYASLVSKLQWILDNGGMMRSVSAVLLVDLCTGYLSEEWLASVTASLPLAMAVMEKITPLILNASPKDQVELMRNCALVIMLRIKGCIANSVVEQIDSCFWIVSALRQPLSSAVRGDNNAMTKRAITAMETCAHHKTAFKPLKELCKQNEEGAQTVVNFLSGDFRTEERLREYMDQSSHMMILEENYPVRAAAANRLLILAADLHKHALSLIERKGKNEEKRVRDSVSSDADTEEAGACHAASIDAVVLAANAYLGGESKNNVDDDSDAPLMEIVSDDRINKVLKLMLQASKWETQFQRRVTGGSTLTAIPPPPSTDFASLSIASEDMSAMDVCTVCRMHGPSLFPFLVQRIRNKGAERATVRAFLQVTQSASPSRYSAVAGLTVVDLCLHLSAHPNASSYLGVLRKMAAQEGTADAWVRRSSVVAKSQCEVMRLVGWEAISMALCSHNPLLCLDDADKGMEETLLASLLRITLDPLVPTNLSLQQCAASIVAHILRAITLSPPRNLPDVISAVTALCKGTVREKSTTTGYEVPSHVNNSLFCSTVRDICSRAFETHSDSIQDELLHIFQMVTALCSHQGAEPSLVSHLLRKLEPHFSNSAVEQMAMDTLSKMKGEASSPLLLVLSAHLLHSATDSTRVRLLNASFDLLATTTCSTTGSVGDMEESLLFGAKEILQTTSQGNYAGHISLQQLRNTLVPVEAAWKSKRCVGLCEDITRLIAKIVMAGENGANDTVELVASMQDQRKWLVSTHLLNEALSAENSEGKIDSFRYCVQGTCDVLRRLCMQCPMSQWRWSAPDRLKTLLLPPYSIGFYDNDFGTLISGCFLTHPEIEIRLSTVRVLHDYAHSSVDDHAIPSIWRWCCDLLCVDEANESSLAALKLLKDLLAKGLESHSWWDDVGVVADGVSSIVKKVSYTCCGRPGQRLSEATLMLLGVVLTSSDKSLAAMITGVERFLSQCELNAWSPTIIEISKALRTVAAPCSPIDDLQEANAAILSWIARSQYPCEASLHPSEFEVRQQSTEQLRAQEAIFAAVRAGKHLLGCDDLELAPEQKLLVQKLLHSFGGSGGEACGGASGVFGPVVLCGD